MELLDVEIKLKDERQPLHLHLWTDIHRSAPGCDSAKLRADIAHFKKLVEKGEAHYWFGGGDWSNAIGPRDKRHDSSAISNEFREHEGDSLFQAEARVLAREFAPIRQWGLGLGMGNHEKSIAKFNDYNPALDVAERLNLPFLGYSALIRLRVSAENSKHVASVLMFWHHGRGAARSRGSKVNAMHSFRDTIKADLYWTGHDHSLIDWPEVQLEGSRKGAFRLVRRDVLYINGGTYLKTMPALKPQKAGAFNNDHIVHSDYAEIAAYTPGVIGHNGARILLDKHGNENGNPGFRLERYECRWD